MRSRFTKELCNDGQHPKTRRTWYVAEKIEGDPSNPSNPSQLIENSAFAISNGDSFVEDVRRITEGSNHAANDPSPNPSGKNGQNARIEAGTEGSKDPKDRETDSFPSTGTVVRHRRERWEGTVTVERSGSTVGVWPFGASASKMVPVEDVEELY